MGNITRDLEVRTISTGTSVCNFSVATNRKYQQNEEWKEEVEFHNVVIWGQRAENLAQRAKKGTRVYIEGRLQTRSWEDQNGSKQFKTEIVVNRVILIDRYERGESSFGGENEDIGKPQEKKFSKASSQTTSGKETVKRAKGSSSRGDDEEIDPDDLPF